MKIYLAGKISKNDWRNGIIETRNTTPLPRNEATTIHGDIYTGPYFVSCDHGCYHGDSKHGILDGCASDAEQAIIYDLEDRCNLTDPDGGHGFLSNGCYDGVRNTIPKLCLSWIDDCDVLFAWIETKDCFGTFTEIGYAYGKGKEIWVGYSNKLVMGYSDRPTEFSQNDGCEFVDMPIHDTWFIDRLASKIGVSPNPEMLYSWWSHEHKHK